MIQPPSHPDEQNRLAALHRYNIMDTLPEAAFDDLTRLAAYICGTPIALVTLIDENRQWLKSKRGMEISETTREEAFCAYTILQDETMVVPDAQQDERFVDNPLVTRDGVRFYAGAPLVTPDGQPIGALCVLDQTPRQLTEEQLDALAILGRQVMAQIEMRGQAAEREQINRELERSVAILQSTLDSISDGVMVVDNDKRVNQTNRAFAELWRIPKHIAESGDRPQLLRWVVDQFEDAQAFVRQANAVYNDPEASTEELLYPRDGRVILRYSHPQRYGSHILGRVIGFRDITERVQSEAEQLRLREEVIAAQNATLAELSTPLIPLNDQAVMMPLIGSVDSRRAQQVVDTLLDGVATHHAEVAILDITGVQVVDTQVAQAIARAAQAVQLLGAKVVITGIRPEVAQTLVSLQVDFGTTVTRGTLQEGIRYVLTRQM